MVHKLLLLKTPTRKSRRVWDQEISGARTEAPGLLSRCDLSIVEVEIHSENVEHPGAISALAVIFENLGPPLLKCYVDHSHTMYSSGNIDVQNWVHLFESRCFLHVLLHGPDVFTLWTHHSYLTLTATMTWIPQQPLGYSQNKSFPKKYQIQSRECKWVVCTNI